MKKRSRSLSFQIPILFILSYAVIGILILLVVYNRFENRMILDYTRMAEGVTQLMANAYDIDKTDEFIEKNYSMDEYNELLKYYYTLKDNYPDIYYMYVYKFTQTDPPIATVIIDLDEEYTDNPPQESIDWIGDVYEVDEPFASEISTILNGKAPVVHNVHTQDGEYLLSYVRPILDENGNYVCSACVDFSMADLHNQDVNFLIKMMSILGISMIIIAFFNVWILTRHITMPLDKMSECIESFVYDTEADRFKNIQRLEELQIIRNDEVGKLYTSFVSNMQESLYYMSNYNKAKGEIDHKDEEIKKISIMTYKDSLTMTNNKAAFQNDLETINKEISAGLRDVGAIMVDVNNLKYINDTFGHEAGDNYIKGCCSIICSIFKHSPVYRMGGDEFVIILKEQDFKNRNMLYAQTTARFYESFTQTDVDPWKKYSASLGMETYEEGDTLEDIVKRADKRMYENKLEFKEKYGSYR